MSETGMLGWTYKLKDQIDALWPTHTWYRRLNSQTLPFRYKTEGEVLLK